MAPVSHISDVTAATSPLAGQKVAQCEEQRGPCGAAAELPLFRFRLKHLLALVAIVSALLAELVAAPGVAGLALLVVTLVVMLHVTATALGTQLQAAGTQTNEETRARLRAIVRQGSSHQLAQVPVSRSSWHGFDSSPLARLPLHVLVGVSIGGVGGLTLLAWSIGYRTSIVGLTVGAVSLAVLGGWIAFLGSSFYAIFRHGWREAVREQRKDETRTRMAAIERATSDDAK